MTPAFLNFAFREDIIQALSWTLIHSLWQGMLLAVVAGSIILFTKSASPALRYNLLTASLLIFVMAVAATFGKQLMNYTIGEQLMTKVPPPAIMPGQSNLMQVVTGDERSLTDKAVDIFNANAAWIVLAWFLATLFRCFRLAAGLYNVYQLKRKQTFLAGEYWDNKIIELSRRLSISRKIRLLQSGISLPSVIGFFKPVILFPAGMLASLPPAEVEVILIHELAHIRRKDFLVNICQHLVEIIFFFNPAVRWVSYLIKSERENCCDEIAVNQTGNKRDYINALMAFQSFELKSTPLASSFSGEKNHLINRVKRIIYNQNQTLNNMEKKLLAAGMIITCTCIFAFSSNKPQQQQIRNFTAVQNQELPGIPNRTGDLLRASPDTLPDNKENKKAISSGTINSTVNGKRYKMLVENDIVTELYVNGKKVPAEKMSDYKSVTGKLLRESRIDRERSRKDLQQSREDLEQSKKEMEEVRLEMEEAREEISHDMEQSKKEMEEQKNEMTRDLEESKIELEKQQEEMTREMKQLKKEQSRINTRQSKKEMQQVKLEMEQAKLEMERTKKQMREDMEQAKMRLEEAKRNITQSKKDMEESMKAMEKSRKDMAESKRLQESVIADLIKEKIIKDKSELTAYKLSNEELVVNGVKQPADIHKKFKERYVKGNNWSIMYNYSSDNDVK